MKLKAWLILPGLLIFFSGNIYGQNQENENSDRPKREISWINPDFQAMDGLTHHVLKSEALGHEVGYVVWTPPTYIEKVKERFPVIYFLHGAGGNESADAAGFSEWVSKSINDGRIEPVICVFPNGGMSGYRNEVEAMIISEIIPLIDKEYRTIAQPNARALAGFSMGGAGSVYLSIMHAELFTAAGSMGGGLRNHEELTEKIRQSIPVWKDSDFGFILINGDEDRPDAFVEFAEILEQNSVDHRVVILPDTKHNLGLYYEKSVEQLIEYLGDKLGSR